MIRDLENNIRFDTLLAPINLTADSNTAAVDMLEYRYAGFYGMIGASADTLSGSVYILLELEESTDNSTYTDVADADITNAVTGLNTGTFAKIDAADEDAMIYMCEYKGSARFVRAVVNLVGSHSSGTPIAVFSLRTGDQSLPVTQGT